MNTQNIFEIKRKIEIKRIRLNELVLDVGENDLILECSMELDKLINIYNKYLKLDYMKGVSSQKELYSEG